MVGQIVPFERLDYGFRWGAVDVERLAVLPGGRVVLRLATPRGSLDVYVTRTGQVRIFEYAPPSHVTIDGDTVLTHGASRGEWARPSMIRRAADGFDRWWDDHSAYEAMGDAIAALRRLLPARRP